MKVIHLKNRMLFFFSLGDPMRGDIVYSHQLAQLLAEAMFSHCISCDSTKDTAHFLSPLSGQCTIYCSDLHKSSLRKLPKKLVSNRKMEKSCAAIGCRKGKGGGASFHRFI